LAPPPRRYATPWTARGRQSSSSSSAARKRVAESIAPTPVPAHRRVTRRADAAEAQLDDGLAFLRSELAKLAESYPDEAARLRIPASVGAIDERLGIATGEG
jgi:hypothetical protein